MGKPKVISYCHWYEVDENTNYSESGMLLTQLQWYVKNAEECE